MWSPHLQHGKAVPGRHAVRLELLQRVAAGALAATAAGRAASAANAALAAQCAQQRGVGALQRRLGGALHLLGRRDLRSGPPTGRRSGSGGGLASRALLALPREPADIDGGGAAARTLRTAATQRASACVTLLALSSCACLSTSAPCALPHGIGHRREQSLQLARTGATMAARGGPLLSPLLTSSSSTCSSLLREQTGEQAAYSMRRARARRFGTTLTARVCARSGPGPRAPSAQQHVQVGAGVRLGHNDGLDGGAQRVPLGPRALRGKQAGQQAGRARRSSSRPPSPTGISGPPRSPRHGRGPGPHLGVQAGEALQQLARDEAPHRRPGAVVHLRAKSHALGADARWACTNSKGGDLERAGRVSGGFPPAAPGRRPPAPPA